MIGTELHPCGCYITRNMDGDCEVMAVRVCRTHQADVDLNAPLSRLAEAVEQVALKATVAGWMDEMGKEGIRFGTVS